MTVRGLFNSVAFWMVLDISVLLLNLSTVLFGDPEVWNWLAVGAFAAFSIHDVEDYFVFGKRVRP